MTTTKLDPNILRLHKGVSFTGITTVYFCHDGQGKLFLTKRSKNTRDEHGMWDPGGGGLKHGSSLEGNVRREVKEEYDAESATIDFIGYHDVFRCLDDGTKTHWLAMIFAVMVDPAQIKVNEPKMVDDYGWFSLNNLPSPMHSQFETVMQKYGDKLVTSMAASQNSKT